VFVVANIFPMTFYNDAEITWYLLSNKRLENDSNIRYNNFCVDIYVDAKV